MTTRIKSPTGVVHAVGGNSVASRQLEILTPFCNNYNFHSTTAWAITDEPVTCRTCLKMTAHITGETTQEALAQSIKNRFEQLRAGCKDHSPYYYRGMPENWTEHYCDRLPGCNGLKDRCHAGSCPLIWK